ncbi:hypothetical protein D3C73_1242880 [compost metagenome]
MLVLIMLSGIGIPLFMLVSAWLVDKLTVLYDGIAVACTYVFGVITALAIYKIIRDDTVFMTNIHDVFNNWIFLMVGAYLGNYLLFRLVLRTLKQWRKS